jgi:hypothetical protein
MIKIEIDWWKLQQVAKASPENYGVLRQAKPELPSLEDALAGKGYMAFEAFINDPSDLPDFIFEHASWKPVRPMKFMNGVKPNAMGIKEALVAHQVHLPGNEMLLIREVQVQEDCCTDMLQQQLTQGWRIIAVCPQPSRRPDYILGKTFEGGRP